MAGAVYRSGLPGAAAVCGAAVLLLGFAPVPALFLETADEG